MNFVCNRHLDIELLRYMMNGARCLHSFCNFTHPTYDLFKPSPASQLLPDKTIAREIACAGQHKIAKTRKPHQSFNVRALRKCESRNFCKPARDESGDAVRSQS